ncbi:hypothetical protein, conserved [Leishmania tarentolae]|uniref:Uncharacterized protein n=1 Tax=Leishmania tarentolae TaxID=5689 RepID=A0A640KQL8_LEITA|nr:hypothetical protein, conserved [Leishmania tarentolae]
MELCEGRGTTVCTAGSQERRYGCFHQRRRTHRSASPLAFRASLLLSYSSKFCSYAGHVHLCLVQFTWLPASFTSPCSVPSSSSKQRSCGLRHPSCITSEIGFHAIGGTAGMTSGWIKGKLVRKRAQAAAGLSTAQYPRSRASSLVGGGPTTPSPTGPAPLKQSAYVIAERMVPSGCSCLLVGRRQQKLPSSSPISSRHRVVIPGIVPGTVLRTRASVIEWMHKCKQLPASTEYTVLMRSGKQVPRHASDAGLAALPCELAATNACQRCPWMGVGNSSESARPKHACWRASLESAVRNMWASTAIPHCGETLTRTYDDTMRCCSFLEPFAVKVTPNRLLALQLFFVSLKCNDSAALSRSPLADSAAPACGTPAAATTMLYVEREGVSRPLSVTAHACQREPVTSATASGGVAQLSSGTLNAMQDCLLESLEQKRLVPALQRWATQLPTSTQGRLLGAFISQPFTWASHSEATTSLQVILVVDRNTDVLGMQSPLCTPSHPADLLSTEEKELVEVVTAAAPLLHEIEVLVWVQSTCTDARQTSTGETVLHRLYPTISRDVLLANVQCETFQDGCVAVKNETEAGELQRGQVTQMVRCWCHPLQKELSVNLPPYHAALCAISLPWLCKVDRHRHQPRHTFEHKTSSPSLYTDSAPGNAARASASVCPQRLPWVRTFWRHAGALDACCSVLLSVLLGSTISPAKTTFAATESDTTHRSEIVEVRAPSLSAHSFAPAEADISAVAGQTILDSAVVALAREATRIVARSEESDQASSFSSCGALLPPTSFSSWSTPRRVLVSVREDDGAVTAMTTAFVNEVLGSVHRRPVCLCFYECTSTMKTAALGAQVARTLYHAQRAGHSVSVKSGIVDVDPLASSFVAYACVSVHT